MRNQYGFNQDFHSVVDDAEAMTDFLNLKLHARGLPTFGSTEDSEMFAVAGTLLSSTREKNRLLARYLCPVDQHIQKFLTAYLADVKEDQDEVLVPTNTLVLDRHGQARALSIPPDRDWFESDIVKSYRVKQGVCHNPKRDRRTTKGVFHIAEGGYPIPADKKAVPKLTYYRLLQRAIDPPAELMRLPFTDSQEAKTETFCSLLLRPLVCPEVPGMNRERRLEVRFFAPGNLAANLDFVESIFGNAGDPFLPGNDARLDIDHWSGHTGCVILAPHLVTCTKKELGLPHVSEATERQKRDGMCWEKDDEIYNEGTPFKCTARDHRGVMVTIIADNYFGYCKKEVKTMISFAANLYGLSEEEHAGGALVFPRRDHGEEFHLSLFRKEVDHSFANLRQQFPDLFEMQPEGYGVDRHYENILYVPEDAQFDLRSLSISWFHAGEDRSIKLLPEKTYVLPSGYKLCMEKPAEGQRWRIIGTNAEGTVCHKPCTVSGGGKSEISKSINDAMVSGTVTVVDIQNDFDAVEVLLHRDYGDRYQNPDVPGKKSRPLLSLERSLGSVIKLLNTNPEYTEAYNAWVSEIPSHIRDLVLLVKRFYKPSWGDDWRNRFTVDTLNGQPGRELKYYDQVILTRHLRMGFEPDGSWRTFSLRKDFIAAAKIQMEDDITASITVPTDRLPHLHPNQPHASVKFIENCEHRLFQRPDDAILRGYDNQAELDFTREACFFSNYQPLPREDAIERIEDAIKFDLYTEPVQELVHEVAATDSPDYYILTSNPRLMEDGVPTKNPRYLQNRPDLDKPRDRYLAEIGVRLYRGIPMDSSVPFPVDMVLPGRRHNPPDAETGTRALAVYNPIHFQELPELFMDYVASLTGKSPSTTGAGSEGALTKAPFNALPPIVDLNNALVSHMVTGYHAFATAAGFVGPQMKVNHDVSMLIPELFSRMRIQERDPKWLIEEGYFEAVEDFEHEGKPVLASRLGFRMTRKFADDFLGRIFSYPGTVFTEEMLRPEKQNLEDYIDGINNIVETMQRVAMNYFDDGSIENACPPLKALLYIMAHGEYEGKGLHDPEIRALFDPSTIQEQDWYQQRIDTRVQINDSLHRRHIKYLERFLEEGELHDEATLALARERLALARVRLAEIQEPGYREGLLGTIGADPMLWVD